MNDSIFREYDIRGKVGSELIIDNCYDLARSIAFYFKRENTRVKTVLVGMDGRLSSPAIKEKIVTALQESGLNVIFIGICPSPVLYFGLHTLSVDAGLMITASHNPGEYNGIKISLGTQCIWGKQITEIRDLYRNQKFLTSKSKGSYQEQALIPAYINWLKEHFLSLMNMNLAVAIDCGNGAGGSVLPDLIKAMQWKHIQLLCAEVDGTYPNHEADPVVEKNMQHVKEALASSNASLGIGLDGDADRMAAMTKTGFLVPGDQLLAIFAQELLKVHPNSAVVFDVKASSGLIEFLQQWGAKPCISPCGHAIIKTRMEKEHALLAGELSCHFFFKDKYFGYDDGIYAMMRLFEIVQESASLRLSGHSGSASFGGQGTSLDELLKVFPKKYSSPEIRIACEEDKKETIINHLITFFKNQADAQLLLIDGLRVTLAYGWALVRPSNTQPVMSMRFEGNSPAELQKIKEEIAVLLSNFFDNQMLKKELKL